MEIIPRYLAVILGVLTLIIFISILVLRRKRLLFSKVTNEKFDISEEKCFICPFCNNVFTVPKKESRAIIICPKCRKIVSKQVPSQTKETTTKEGQGTQQTKIESIQGKQDNDNENAKTVGNEKWKCICGRDMERKRSNYTGEECLVCKVYPTDCKCKQKIKSEYSRSVSSSYGYEDYGYGEDYEYEHYTSK